MFSTDVSSLYMSESEMAEIEARQLIRDKSVRYCIDSIFYGVPVKLKAVVAANSPTNARRDNGPVDFGAGNSSASDPDMVFMTIDIQKIIKERKLDLGQRDGDMGGDVVMVDADTEFNSYPEAVAVDKYGDILVTMRGQGGGQRKILGLALQVRKPEQERKERNDERESENARLRFAALTAHAALTTHTALTALREASVCQQRYFADSAFRAGRFPRFRSRTAHRVPSGSFSRFIAYPPPPLASLACRESP